MFLGTATSFGYVGSYTGSVASFLWGMVFAWTGAGMAYLYKRSLGGAPA